MNTSSVLHSSYTKKLETAGVDARATAECPSVPHNSTSLLPSRDSPNDDPPAVVSAKRISLSPVAPSPPPSAVAMGSTETDSDSDSVVSRNDDHSVPEEKNNGPNASDPRRSSRATVSTMIYVNGQYIKKANNYVVRGGEYVYGGLVGQEPPVRTTAAANTTAAASATTPKAPRALSVAELDRLDRKKRVEVAIGAKAPGRHAILHAHAKVLEPFLEDKVLDRILQEAPPSDSTTTTTTTASPMDRAVCTQPASITASMRDYQVEGLTWMSHMYEKNLGMILGDEMGLGKTLQTIALVCHLKEKFGCNGPSLVVCPLSVLYSWCNEIQKWAPTLKFLRLHNSQSTTIDVSTMAQYDIVVTTYEMAKAPWLRNTLWRRQTFNLLVLDEGHRIKSTQTQISQAVRGIHAECRLILTGTPLANDLVELWSLLNFLAPDIFSSSAPFADAFDVTLRVCDREKLEQAHVVLQLFMLRRLKVDVEQNMPKKIETKVICPLSNTQIWWYKSILLKDISILTGTRKATQAKILNNLIMQLRKCCIHPYLFPEAEDIETTTLRDLVGASGKLAVLDKLLASLYEKGHRVCLFSQFTSALDILDDYCNLRGWEYCRLDGSTSRAKRNYIVNSFNAPNSSKFLFLMSTRAGGMGLNLQTADTCVLFDSDWNPQPDIQAMARVHRIGQTKTVHVYRLVTEGTVEQRMVERAEKKLYLDKMVTRDGAPKELMSSMDGEADDVGKLMNTLKFGCQAVFGKNTLKNTLPTDEDIAIITDRARKEDFSSGNLVGGVDEQAEKFDATKKFTETTKFSGIDFSQIRREHKKSKELKDMASISEIWRKRRRKNRITMVASNGSGYGLSMVPVLAANEYDLETGERSVFVQELRGKVAMKPKKRKATAKFEWQDICQKCGDGGHLVCCPGCPVSLHLECAGIQDAKHLLCCSHHRCMECDKPSAAVGGFLFPCSACTASFCEDHLPPEARFLESNPRMEQLGFHINQGVYIHCSKECEDYAIAQYGYSVPEKQIKKPCPPKLDLSTHFGGAVDESLDAPDELIITGKRTRKNINYAMTQKISTKEKSTKKLKNEHGLFKNDDGSVETYCTEGNKTEDDDGEFVPEVVDLIGSDDDDLVLSPDVIEFRPNHCTVVPSTLPKTAAPNDLVKLQKHHSTVLPKMVKPSKLTKEKAMTRVPFAILKQPPKQAGVIPQAVPQNHVETTVVPKMPESISVSRLKQAGIVPRSMPRNHTANAVGPKIPVDTLKLPTRQVGVVPHVVPRTGTAKNVVLKKPAAAQKPAAWHDDKIVAKVTQMPLPIVPTPPLHVTTTGKVPMHATAAAACQKAYEYFFNEEMSLLARNRPSLAHAAAQSWVRHLWHMLSPAQVTVYERLASLPCRDTKKDEYEVCLPVTAHGLMVYMCETNHTVAFSHYGRYPNGELGHPELAQVFRGNDQVIAVDGQICEDWPFLQVVSLLSDQMGKRVKIVRMKRVNSFRL